MKNKIKKICMISVHGYVSARPTLGKTDTGGQVMYVLELSKALAEKGVKVDIYTRKFQKQRSIEKVARNVRIIRIPCGSKKFIPKEKLLPHLNSFVKNMKKFIEKENLSYDIYHSHYWDAGYAAMKLTEKLGTFFVHTFHSLGAWKKNNMGGTPAKMEAMYKFKERIKHEKIIFKKTKSLIMTSPVMVNISGKYYNYKEKNYAILPAGVNTGILRPLKKNEKETKIDVPHNYAFWVGRFDTNKGLDHLIKGFSEVVSSDKDLFLVIGGGSTKPTSREKRIKQDLKKIIDKKKIRNRVFFTGHIKDTDLASYFRKANFFVLPSKFEPFGMAAAEALACGTPLIASERAGITKYLKSGVDFIKVNASNKKDIARALSVLNNNASLHAKLSKNGVKVAKDKFSWIKIAEKSLSHYNTLI